MQKMSKVFYLGSFAVSILGAILLGVGAAVTLRGGISNALPLWLLGAAALLSGSVVMLIFIHRMWQSIQDGHARTSPRKAVGFLFIPFFNLYWIFQVLWGFSKDYNSFVDRHPTGSPKLPEGLFLACNILMLTTCIPYLNILTTLAYWGIFFVLIFKICDAVNALPDGGAAAVNVGPLGGVAQRIRLLPRLSLYCVSGEFAQDTVEIPVDGMYVGRDPAKVNLVLGSDQISGVHVRVWPDSNSAQVWVEDWNSLNGTFYCQPGAGGSSRSEWIPLQGKVLLGNGARFRLGSGVAEFEIRTA